MIWSDTDKIGCGVSKYLDRGWYSLYLVCNYGPGGNIIGNPVYFENTLTHGN